jgi:hypothetical protein
MLTKEEILPCPFCNGEPILIERGNEHTRKRSAEIECTSCHVKMIVGAIHNSLEWCKETVIEKWNEREYSNQDKWISVKDEMPEYIGCYLTLTNDSNIMVCHVNALGDWTLTPPKKWYGDLWASELDKQSYPNRAVTHWQKLPNPPKQ